MYVFKGLFTCVRRRANIYVHGRLFLFINIIIYFILRRHNNLSSNWKLLAPKSMQHKHSSSSRISSNSASASQCNAVSQQIQWGHKSVRSCWYFGDLVFFFFVFFLLSSEWSLNLSFLRQFRYNNNIFFASCLVMFAKLRPLTWEGRKLYCM